MGGSGKVMLNYLQWSVEELFQRAASPAPEPGGGGVSAMTGCLASGMLAMVARITGGKDKYRDVEQEIGELIENIDRQMEKMKVLAHQDMEAFHHFMEALALPKETGEQKALREASRQQAAILSASVPLDIARACLNNLEAAARLAAIGSPLAISDVGVGAHLLEASLKGALMMVDANLPYIGDGKMVYHLTAEKERLTLEGEELCRTTLETVKARMK